MLTEPIKEPLGCDGSMLQRYRVDKDAFKCSAERGEVRGEEGRESGEKEGEEKETKRNGRTTGAGG